MSEYGTPTPSGAELTEQFRAMADSHDLELSPARLDWLRQTGERILARGMIRFYDGLAGIQIFQPLPGPDGYAWATIDFEPYSPVTREKERWAQPERRSEIMGYGLYGLQHYVLVHEVLDMPLPDYLAGHTLAENHNIQRAAARIGFTFDPSTSRPTAEVVDLRERIFSPELQGAAAMLMNRIEAHGGLSYDEALRDHF